MQPCGLFQLLSCSRFAFPSGLSGPWQVCRTYRVGQSIMAVAGYRIPDRKHEAQDRCPIQKPQKDIAETKMCDSETKMCEVETKQLHLELHKRSQPRHLL